MVQLALALRLLLAGVFAAAGVAKLADPAGARAALRAFGVPEAIGVAGGTLLPLLELGIAVGLLVSATAWWSASAAFVLLAVFSGAIATTLAHGRAPDCHCFGRLSSAPIGRGTLVRNLVFAAFAVLILASHLFGGQLSGVAWVGRLNSAERILAIAVSVLGIGAMLLGWLMLEVLRQNGRILTRISFLEDSQRLIAPEPRGPSAQVRQSGHRDSDIGLPIGASAPHFELATVDGKRQDLQSLLDSQTPLLLIFTDPSCSPCNALLPDVGQWQRAHGDRLTVALISAGPAERAAAKAAEHNLRNLLLQNTREISDLYRAPGTPSALTVSRQGRIGSSLATGPDAIRALVTETINGLLETPSLTVRADAHDEQLTPLAVASAFQLPPFSETDS
jgi:peroxiredoxin